MKKPLLAFFCVMLMAIAINSLALAGSHAGASTHDKSAPDDSTHDASSKKGIGLEERLGQGAAQLDSLKVAWYYNWGPETKVSSHILFVPMIWSMKDLNATITGDYVLGYNEPNNTHQSGISVQDALKGWPTIAAKAKFVGSPAMSGTARKPWLAEFLKAKPRVDFISVHWYGGADAKKLIGELEAVHKTYNLPIWLTEYAPQDHSDSEKDPKKYSQAQIDQFITQTSDWMDKCPYIQRYAWHNSGVGPCAIFDSSGALTPTGKTYAGMH